jgi:hypothetical protein
VKGHERRSLSDVPLRAMPQPGGPVLIDYLGTTVRGTVKEVADDGRRLEVVTEEGATLIFELNRATAIFTAGGGQTAPRLRFL